MASLLLNAIAYLPISITGYKDITIELINAFQLLSTNAGLLWIID